MRRRSAQPTTWRAAPTALVVVCFLALGALAARANPAPAPVHHAAPLTRAR
jgi:hypothetical protein